MNYDTIKVIYPSSTGDLYVMHLTGELPLEDCCQRDVPAGVPYLIVSADDIPTDRTFRDAWEADFSNPDGYGIGADAYLAAKEVSE